MVPFHSEMDEESSHHDATEPNIQDEKKLKEEAEETVQRHHEKSIALHPESCNELPPI